MKLEKNDYLPFGGIRMGHANKNIYFFGKKLPAWIFVAALVIVGAGAATGLVLKDQVTGTTTIAVSQAIRVAAPVNGPNSDADEFLGTANDNEMEFGAHFEANNGDLVSFVLEVRNYAGNMDYTVVLLTLDIAEGMTVDILDVNLPPAAIDDIVRINYNQWKFEVPDGGMGGTNPEPYGFREILIEIALEDAQPTGFYALQGSIIPLNV